MHGSRPIGKTVRRFPSKGCSGIKLDPGVTLKEGMTIRFEREASMGGHGFHDSIHTVFSIEINHEPRKEVTAEDGICSTKIKGGASNVPPCGCVVLLLDDRQHDVGGREASSYMAKSGL